MHGTNPQQPVDPVTWLYSVGSERCIDGRSPMPRTASNSPHRVQSAMGPDAAAGPKVIDAWCSIEAQLKECILLEVRSAVREASEEATTELRAAATEFRKLRSRNSFSGAGNQCSPRGRSPRRCAHVENFGDADLDSIRQISDEQLAVFTEISKVSEGLNLVGQDCESFFQDSVNLWEDLPSSWRDNLEMVDSIVEELICQDLSQGCAEQLDISQGCAEQVDVQIARCLTNEPACQDVTHDFTGEQEDTQIDKVGVGISACKELLLSAVDDLDTTHVCGTDVQSIPISTEEDMDMPMGTSVLGKSGKSDLANLLPAMKNSAEEPMASILEDCVDDTPTSPPKHLRDLDRPSSEELVEACKDSLVAESQHIANQANRNRGGNLDLAMAATPTMPAQSGSIDTVIHNSVPQGVTSSGSIDFAVANSLPQGVTSSGSTDFASAPSVRGGSIDLAVANSMPQGIAPMKRVSVRRPNTDRRQMVASARSTQDATCRPWEAFKSARFPASAQRCPPGVVTFCIGSDSPPAAGSGYSGGKPMCFNMSPRVRDAVLLFERQVKRNGCGAVSHRAEVRPNFNTGLIGGMGGRIGINPGAGHSFKSNAAGGSIVMEPGPPRDAVLLNAQRNTQSQGRLMEFSTLETRAI
mmetsp:Transcript_137393/g.274139  ORF Transcript_137393/g.274139 Transcript_137393/m.274139 type:complete len:639 (+) Transcript_137393:40-1956(+)